MPETSGGISTSRMVNSKLGGPEQERAKEMYWPSSAESVRLRCLSKKSLMETSEGIWRLASSFWMASRRGWLAGEARSALYPTALMAAMTVKRLGLASSWPVSARAARGTSKSSERIKRDNGMPWNFQFTAGAEG